VASIKIKALRQKGKSDMCKKLLVLWVLVFGGLNADATIGVIKISGVIKSYDELNVVLQQTEDQISIPRKFIKTAQLKKGGLINVALQPKDFDELLKTQQARKN
jgi:hypothetical protein